jgi:uncharacterized protein (TIGR03790 family)
MSTARQHHRWWLAAACLLVCASAMAAQPAATQPYTAPITPLSADELLLVCNRDDPASAELARHYAKVRSVPEDRVFAVRANPRQEEITRELFERDIRGPIRRQLESVGWGRRIRCILLFYGLPLRVGARAGSPAEQKIVRKWQEEQQAGLADLRRLIDRLDHLAAVPATRPASSPSTAPGKPSTLAEELQCYARSLAAAGVRITRLRTSGQGEAEMREFIELLQRAEGNIGLMVRSPRPADGASEAAAQWDNAFRQLQAAEEQAGRWRDRPLTDPDREKARPLILANRGLIGHLQSLQYDAALARTEESVASVDSELTLAWWGPYILSRWVPNLLCWRVQASPELMNSLPPAALQTPVLMTCRIDGSTPAVARRIIDESITVEKAGLTGKVYIDARGLTDKEAYGVYDEDLRDLAALLTRETTLPLKLDNRPDVFATRSCPNTALYCGWYAVRRFVDSSVFAPGAIGYHIASFEAVSLKTPGERGWVKNLLDKGIDATLGPVAEPYLQAFPRPRDFFGLLLTGRFTLAECFAYTSEFNSWMMILLGDPLYRPFAARPQLSLEVAIPAERTPPAFRAAPTTAPDRPPG